MTLALLVAHTMPEFFYEMPSFVQGFFWFLAVLIVGIPVLSCIAVAAVLCIFWLIGNVL